MSAANLGGEFRYSSLKSVQAVLRVLPKLSEGRQCRDEAELRRRGFIKSYIHRDAVLITRLRWGLPGPPHEFYAVFVRDWLGRHRQAGEYNRAGSVELLGHGPEVDGSSSGHFEADGVLCVRERGYGANKGAPAFVRVRSRVWFLASDQIPKLARDALFPGFLIDEFMGEPTRTIHPRVVRIFDRLPYGSASCEEHLIERVPQVVERIGGVLFDANGHLAQQDNLLQFPPSFAVLLGNQAMLCSPHEIVPGALGGGVGAVCPLHKFLRLGERVAHWGSV